MLFMIQVFILICSYSVTVTVQKSEKINGKRNLKTDYCLFCSAKYRSNISKHYISIHKDEPKVKNILKLPLKSKERKKQLIKLQNDGNFKHNSEVSLIK